MAALAIEISLLATKISRTPQKALSAKEARGYAGYEVPRCPRWPDRVRRHRRGPADRLHPGHARPALRAEVPGPVASPRRVPGGDRGPARDGRDHGTVAGVRQHAAGP